MAVAKYLIDISKVVEIFCSVDDFCKLQDDHIEKKALLGHQKPINSGGKAQLSNSEIMTITIFYQLSGLKNFQYYYQVW